MKQAHLAVGIFWRMVGFCIFGGMLLGGIYGALLMLVLPMASALTTGRPDFLYLGISVLSLMGGMFGALFGVATGAGLGLSYGMVLAALSLLFPQSLDWEITHSKAVGATLAITTTLVVAVGLPVALDHDHRLFYGFEGWYVLTSVVPALIAGLWCGWCISRVLAWARQELPIGSAQTT